MIMDAPPKDLPNFQVKFEHFKSLTDAEKQEIKKKSKAESIHQATKVWTCCFDNSLGEKGMESIDEISTEDLPEASEGFCTETCKKGKHDGEDYKNSTLKCIQAGINRHFKATCSINNI